MLALAAAASSAGCGAAPGAGPSPASAAAGETPGTAVGAPGPAAGAREALLPRPTAVELAVTERTSFALLPSGLVLGWGSVGDPDGTGLLSPRPTLVLGLEDVARIAGGPGELCAVRIDGTLVCLSTDEMGLGSVLHGTAGPREVPLPGPALDVSISETHACAVIADGRVACWGSDEHGEVGAGPAERCAVPPDEIACVRAPRLVAGIEDAARVAAGHGHTCALGRGGDVRCWGEGVELALGVAGLERSDAPLLVEGVGAATELVSGWDFSCAREAEGGAVRCWGGGDPRHFGHVSPDAGRQRHELGALAGAHELVATALTICGVRDDGRLICARRPAAAAPTTLPRGVPTIRTGGRAGVDVPLDEALLARIGATSLALGLWHACVRREDGGVGCWGSNRHGALGDPWATSSPRPVAVLAPDGTPVSDDARTAEAEPAASRADDALAATTTFDFEAIPLAELDEGRYPPSRPTPQVLLRAALARAGRSVRACAEAARMDGRVVVAVDVGAQDAGRAHVALASLADGDAEVGACIVAALRAARWPVLDEPVRATFALDP